MHHLFLLCLFQERCRFEKIFSKEFTGFSKGNVAFCSYIRNYWTLSFDHSIFGYLPSMYFDSSMYMTFLKNERFFF